MGRARQWWAALRARPVPAVLITALLVVPVALAVASLRTPGEASARQVVEDYLAARVADDCGHYAFYSEALARSEHVDVKDCQAGNAVAQGEHLEYAVTDVQVDGVRARIDVEDGSDAPSGSFTVGLVVEDGEWRIGDIEERD